MSLRSDESDVNMDAGTVEHPGSMSVSTDVAISKKLSQEANMESVASESLESMNIDNLVSPM